MSFLNLLNGLLTELNVPFYEGAPDFGQDPAPQAFIYYSAHDVPKLRRNGHDILCYDQYSCCRKRSECR